MLPSQPFRIAWRIALTVLLLVLLIFLSLRGDTSRAGAQSGSDPLVLAFYYTWFDENTWTSGTLSDLPAQRYVSADRSAMGRHIEQAQAAGIDGFVVAWYGPSGNQTEGNLAALLEEAAARNFRVAILFESDSPFMPGPGEATAALQHAMASHVQQSAYLRVDGRPVFFFWRTQRYGLETWRTLRDAADPGRDALWIADGVDTGYLTLFDGHHLYSNTWNPPANLESVNLKFAGQVEGYRQSTGAPRVWAATVMPGYNDVRVRPSGGFAQDREGGAYYDRSWAAALASAPNWIVITSFNEWPEGSHIEPSQAYGEHYLGATAAWSSRFKQGGGQAASFATTAAPATMRAATVDAAPPAPEVIYESPTLLVETALLNIRSGPGTEYDVLGTAAAGDALEIVGRASEADVEPGAGSGAAAEWWLVRFGAQSGWASGDFGRAFGPLEAVPMHAFAAESAEAAALQTAGAEAAPPADGLLFAGLQPRLSPRP